jgi:hypothetical protein
MSKPLLLLAAPSRESQDKAAHFAAAAKSLGLPVHTIIADRAEIVESRVGADGFRFTIACTDALALCAARLNERQGSDALSTALIEQLSDKATGIPMLSRMLDLPLLPQCLPQAPKDILEWPWSGPIFVKPTRSAGGWSPRPWGYKHFSDKKNFLDWLYRENYVACFFDEQMKPSSLGPAILQAAVLGGRSEAAMFLLTPSRLQVIYSGFGEFEPNYGGEGGPRWRRAIYCNGAAPELFERLPYLQKQRDQDPKSWGIGILHTQGIRSAHGFHLTDINLRLSTSWDWLVGATDCTVHRCILSALLFDDICDYTPRAPVMMVDLINGNPFRNVVGIQHPPLPPEILPVRLTPQDCRPPLGGFDKAGSSPCFVTLGDDVESCIARAEAFRAGIRIEYAPEAAQ